MNLLSITEINLLPWREQASEQEKKKVISRLLIGILGTLILLCAGHYYLSALIENQRVRNGVLKKEITLIDERIKAINLLKRSYQDATEKILHIQRLYASSSLIIHLLDELIKNVPEGIYLRQLERTADKVILSGYAQSNTDVSTFLHNIKNNLWIQNPTLREIKKTEEAKQDTDNLFSVHFILKSKG